MRRKLSRCGSSTPLHSFIKEFQQGKKKLSFRWTTTPKNNNHYQLIMMMMVMILVNIVRDRCKQRNKNKKYCHDDAFWSSLSCKQVPCSISIYWHWPLLLLLLLLFLSVFLPGVKDEVIICTTFINARVCVA